MPDPPLFLPPREPLPAQQSVPLEHRTTTIYREVHKFFLAALGLLVLWLAIDVLLLVRETYEVGKDRYRDHLHGQPTIPRTTDQEQ